MSEKKHWLLKAFDVQSVFFIPLWRRVVLVGASALWAVVEYVNGGPMWALLFGAISLYCAHQFFIAFDPVEKKD